MEEIRKGIVFDKNGNPKYRIHGLKNELLSDLYHKFLTKSWLMVLFIIFALSMIVNIIFTSFYMTCNGINNATHWYDYFFFSIQTLSTIGYGFMYPTNLCSHVLVAIQSFMGMLFVSFLTGIVFAKFSLPRAKILYTKNIVIHHENNDLMLKLRITNKRGNQIIDANIRAVVLKLEKLSDGTNFRKIQDLNLLRERIPMFSLSFTVQHKIDENSPFFGETHESLLEKQVMVIITINGIDESLTQTLVSKYFYAFEDIKWGMKFKDVLVYDENGEMFFEYDNFDVLIEEKI